MPLDECIGLFSTVEDASADRFRYADFPLPMFLFDLLV